MAKVDRRLLSRGIKLLREHITDLLVDGVKAEIDAGTVGQENLEEPTLPFRVNFYIPLIDSAFFEAADPTFYTGTLPWSVAKDEVAWFMPFMLPPPQSLFSSTGVIDKDDPVFVLDEVQFSCDTRGEPGVIVDQVGGAAGAGKVNYEDLTPYDLVVQLLQKRPIVLDGGRVPTRDVFTAQINGASLTTRLGRQNPAVFGGLSRTLSPYSTYILAIKAPNLYNSSGPVRRGLVNVCVSLKMRSTRQGAFESGSQNFPTNHSITSDSLSLPSIFGGTNIEESGLQGAIHAFDEWVRGKIGGGMSKDGQTDAPAPLADTSGYHVIAVPMWNGMQGYVDATAHGSGGRSNRLPVWSSGPREEQPTCDRRFIPIDRPLIVEHVLAAVSMVAPATPSGGRTDGGAHPTSATLAHDIGVGIGTGLRSDLVSYEQVARRQFTTKPNGSMVVDEIKWRDGSTTMCQDDVDCYLIDVPIQTGSASGTGWNAQGTPYYIGKAASTMQARDNVNDGFGGSRSPRTKGCEQWIEVRWKIQDTGGFETAAGAADEVLVPSTGHFVYLLCRAPAVGSGGDLPL